MHPIYRHSSFGVFHRIPLRDLDFAGNRLDHARQIFPNHFVVRPGTNRDRIDFVYETRFAFRLNDYFCLMRRALNRFVFEKRSRCQER